MPTVPALCDMLGQGALAKISLFIPSPVLRSERLKLLKTHHLLLLLPPVRSSAFLDLPAPKSQAYTSSSSTGCVCVSSLQARKAITMSLISMTEARLPPGFRFHPRDDELVLDYLCRKLSGKGRGGAYGGIAMVDVDLNKCEPWDLPDEACVGGHEWYFFSLHDRKYATGQRTNRATRSGYWKATGKDRPISISGRRGGGGGGGGGGGALLVGMRKTLVFYQGRAPRGSKTEWVMHEFRVDGPAVADRPDSPLQEDWVLCRVFYKSRTTTTRPAAGPDEAGSLSTSCELIGLPMPQMPPADDAYLAFDRTPAAGGYYHHQYPGLGDAHHHQPPAAAAQPFGNKSSLSSFRDLLSSMVEGSDDAAVRETTTELHLQGWTEAAYAQAQQQGGAVMPSSHSQQTWNPFLSSG